MKIITKKKREIKLEKLLYKEYLKQRYVVYNYQYNQITVKRDTDYTYRKWRAQKFIINGKNEISGVKELSGRKDSGKLE